MKTSSIFLARPLLSSVIALRFHSHHHPRRLFNADCRRSRQLYFSNHREAGIDPNGFHLTASLFLLVGGLSTYLLNFPAVAYDDYAITLQSICTEGQSVTTIDGRYFIAGGLAASFSHGIATPIDVIKTRVQASPDLYLGGIINATLSIVQKEGTAVLLCGLGPTLLGYGVEGAIKFGIYESLKPFLIFLFCFVIGPSPDHTLPFLASSVIAGSLASLLLCPMEAARVQSVTDPNSYSGFFQTLTRIVRDEGFTSIFYGLSPMLLKQVPYTMAKQVTFDTVTSLLHTFLAASSFQATLSQRDESLIIPLSSAFFASVVACIISHPGDVLLTETYRNRSKHREFFRLISDKYSERGMHAFFVGLSARLFHVGAIITSQLVLYDYMKQVLGLPPTGT